MSRAYTKKELRENLLHHIHNLINYWNRQPETEINKLEGLAHSILVALDGNALAVHCRYNLVADPHPDDKEYAISCGDNYVEPGMIINDDINMHSIFFRSRKK